MSRKKKPPPARHLAKSTPAAPLQRRRSLRALCTLLLAIFSIGIVTLPAQMYTGDPKAWREEARSIVLHGTLHVDEENVKQLKGMGTFFVFNYTDGRWYSRYGILNGIITAVPFLAEKLVTGELPLSSPDRVVYLGVFFALFSVAIAAVLYEITGYYTTSIAARVAYVLLAFYTTYLWNYLRSTTSESTQLLLLSLCYLFFLRFEALAIPLEKRPRADLYWAWGALLLLCLTKISYLTALPLFALILLRLAMKSDLPRKAWPAFIARDAALPMILIIGVLGVVNDIKFGYPLFTGYHQGHEVAYEHTFWEATADFLWGAQGSIFIHFPLLLLALAGAKRFFRHYPNAPLLPLGCFLITYILIAPAGAPWRGEWCYGPRYFIPMLPLLALPALYPLEWMFTPPYTPLRLASLTAGVLAALFLAFAQMEINRLDPMFKYRIFQERSDALNKEPPIVRDYFLGTNYAKINWDHLQAEGDWTKLPYYDELKKHADPGVFEQWKKYLNWEISRSNLYWFPGNVRNEDIFTGK